MVDFGSASDVINATQVRLYRTNTSNQFLLLQELELVLDRPETREAVALGAVYFFGQHNHVFDATCLASAGDIATFVGWNDIANGDLPDAAYLCRYVSKGGTTKTVTVQAELPRMSFEKLPEGGVKFRARFRIIDEVQASDVS